MGTSTKRSDAPRGGWRYGLTKDGKPAFVAGLEKQTDPALFEKWRKPLGYVLQLITDAEARAAKKTAHAAGRRAAAKVE